MTREENTPASSSAGGESYSNAVTRYLAVVLFAAGVLGPILWVSLKGSSLTAVYEESIGYRYFYTLRQIYEGTYLFLPQGQSANLIFKLVHLALEVLGYPVTQIRPRIEYFYLASIALFQLINVCAFVLLLRESRSSNPVVAAFFWLLPFFAPGAAAAYILLMPDYLAVEPAVAMVSASLLLAAYRSDAFTVAAATKLALLLGFCLATKITLAIFPCVILLFIGLSSSRRAIDLRLISAIVMAGIGIWLIVLCIDLGFRPRAIAYQLRDLGNFVRYGGGVDMPPDPWLSWIFIRAREMPWISGGVYLMPILGGLPLLFVRDRRTVTLFACLLVGAVLSSAVLYRRDYYITLIESTFYAFMYAWCVWCVGIEKRAEGRMRLAPYQSGLVWGILVLGGTAVGFHLTRNFARSDLSRIEKTTLAERQLATLRESVGGRQLWLVPDNYGRPMSIDSSIMKGGSGTNGLWLEPDSPLMRRAVPDLDFRFERNDNRPLRLAEYAAVLFMTNVELAQRMRELNDRYQVDLSQLQCKELVTMETGLLVMCLPK